MIKFTKEHIARIKMYYNLNNSKGNLHCLPATRVSDSFLSVLF